MKQANKLFLLIFGATLFLGACNKSDNGDWLREQARLDSIENARIKKTVAEQAPLLKTYVENPSNGWTNPIIDTAFGIWYEILTPGDPSSYNYKINGNSLMVPTVEVKYKGQLLNGTIFDETSEDTPSKKTAKFNLSQVIPVWRIAFFPKQLSSNGQNFPVGGLTANGLKKGAKIRFVTPSPWAYDTQAREKIPANSPLIFEIEVVDINDSL